MAKILGVINGSEVIQDDDLRVYFVAGAAIDADGGYRAYHPGNIGLDNLRNAGKPGNWYGIVTDERGNPYLQGPNDPFPGYYISSTSYQNTEFPRRDPRRYLDSEKIPFIVVPSSIQKKAKGVVMGSRAMVEFKGRKVDCVVGDTGPARKIGELSIAAAKLLGMNHDPRTGGEDSKTVSYQFWPNQPAEIGGVKYVLQPMGA